MKVYPPRDIRPFVMYCVNGKPRSSLLIESTDPMINTDFIAGPNFIYIVYGTGIQFIVQEMEVESPCMHV